MIANGCHEEVVFGSVSKVIGGLPTGLEVGDLDVALEPAVTVIPWVGKLASHRRTGSWASGRFRGRIVVDVIPANGELSLLSVTLEPPTGWRRHLLVTANLDAAAIAAANALRDVAEGSVTAEAAGSLMETRGSDAIAAHLGALGT